MLIELLKSYPEQFEALAQSWLDAGAGSFSVCVDDRVLSRWPKAEPGSPVLPILSAPIRVGNRIVGELRISGIDGSTAQARLTAEAGLFGSLAPLARDLFHVTAELVNTRDQILAIYNLSQINRSCLEVEQNLRNLVAQLPHLIKSESAFVLLRVDDHLEYVVHNPAPIFNDDALWSICKDLHGEEPRLFAQAGADWPEQVRNLLVLPMRVRGTKTAVLGLINKAGGRFLSPDIKLVRAIGAYASAQIENILMFQENMRLARMQTEMELAQQVQLSLLPKELPIVDGIELCASSFPALLVGGDFYDFIVRPGMPLTLAVGDLSGKGFPAALLMSMTRTMLRTEMNVFSTPAGILKGMNADLYDDFTRLSSFATLFIAQYFPTRQEIHFANAGHSPVILCPVGQTPRMLEADGTAMGILPNTTSHDQSLQLYPGDVLLIGTDGLAEASSRVGERFTYQRLIDLAGSLVNLPAHEISQAIYKAVGDFSAGVDQDDDQTLVVLKCVNKMI